jgi:hypothetical protein
MFNQFSHRAVTALLSEVKDFYGPIRAHIIAAGWVQTEDTGQVDLDTYNVAPAINQVVGFQVFRMNDLLQPTHPVYMRLEYVLGSATVIWPTIRVRFSLTGTDGAGTLTGTQSPSYTLTASSAQAGAAWSFMSGEPDRLAMVLCTALQSTNATQVHTMLLSVERSKDADGDNTGDFIHVMIASPGGNYVFLLHRDFGLGLVDEKACTAMPYSIANLAYGAGGAIAPIFPWGGRVENPIINFAIGKKDDHPHVGGLQIEAYGQTRNYRSFLGTGSTPGLSALAPINGNNAALMMLWE